MGHAVLVDDSGGSPVVYLAANYKDAGDYHTYKREGEACSADLDGCDADNLPVRHCA